MERPKDLKRVGQWLRTQRTEQHIARTALARKVGVSPTYLWMVEEARTRANGEASQPSQFLLSQLSTELGCTAEETYELLRLAGYTPVDDAPMSTDAVAQLSPRTRFDTVPRHGSGWSLEPTHHRQRLLQLLDEVRQGILETDVTLEPVIPRFRTELRSFLPQSPLFDALQLMDEQRYSQVVVQDGGHLRLLSAEGIVRWLLDHASKERFLLMDVTIGDVLTAEPPDTVLVRPSTSTIEEATAAFVRQPSLVAILLTPTGTETELPLGIITAWDLIDALHEHTFDT